MKRIRALVVDDSATMCNVLSALLSKDPDIEVVGCAHDGEQAIAMAEALLPDVITMDVQMPRLDGLEAIAKIMMRAPARILAVCSVDDGSSLDLSFRAIAAGALELVAKPRSGPGYDIAEWGRRLVESVRLMAEVPVVRRRGPIDTPTASLPRSRRVEIIAIAASTGGPNAIVTILAAMPADIPVPILIAQHMAPGFMRGFARWLEQVTPMRVVMSKTGETCQAGHVYLPPDEHDHTVDMRAVLTVSPSAELHCPSADRLLFSVASAFGARAAGVVLTGMGEDGARGLLAIREANGVTMAQDEATSVVYGMPQAAFQLGATSVCLPLDAIADALKEVTNDRRGAEA
jgi:two-component system, chemotaxis family, protein-glutamate methylesterase/glutaminase